MKCPVDVQGEGSNPLKEWAFQAHDLKKSWSELVVKLNQKDLAMVATMYHNIWGQRDKVVFDNNFVSPKDLSLQSLKLIGNSNHTTKNFQTRAVIIE